MSITITISTKGIRRFLYGSYSDGRVRNFRDAINGEYISPKQKKHAMKLKNKPKVKFKL